MQQKENPVPEKGDKNTTGAPREVPEDVKEKQDPEYDEDDFDEALKRVTRRLDDPAGPAPGSPRR